jgi:hypothetical protein
MTLHFRKVAYSMAHFLFNLVAALGFLVIFFSLIAYMDRPSPKRDNLPSLDNPSGRPPPTKRYLPKDKEPKKPLKPSKLPDLPSIPAPSFSGLHGPSKLPTLPRTPTY